MDTDGMVLTTTVGTAKTGSKSLRATIPEGIVEFLQIKAGDKITWEMTTDGEKRLVIVKKKVEAIP